MDGYIGQILLFAGNFAPRNWAYCQGQIISIAQNSALFAILGTTYGGNGQTTFALPNFSSRTPVGVGQGNGLQNVSLGEMRGAETFTLTTSNMPSHSHTLYGTDVDGNVNVPTNALLAKNGDNSYLNTGGQGMMANATIGMTGAGQPFNNRQPYLGINFVICLYGIFPSRN
ncbi:MAG: tail fiber protein [Haliscomenobacter sp.]|uniref:phage tail protein n=1 Tax=Haliscomenobacter sp. TaxID=2717303 RepID=UPI0029A7C329|nr:tail fiber protein [Haliscomenobacter sp.]MDX2067072.1 tail fiber protein [Haliscomenobacter sp.]